MAPGLALHRGRRSPPSRVPGTPGGCIRREWPGLSRHRASWGSRVRGDPAGAAGTGVQPVRLEAPSAQERPLQPDRYVASPRTRLPQARHPGAVRGAGVQPPWLGRPRPGCDVTGNVRRVAVSAATRPAQPGPALQESGELAGEGGPGMGHRPRPVARRVPGQRESCPAGRHVRAGGHVARRISPAARAVRSGRRAWWSSRPGAGAPARPRPAAPSR